MHYRPRPSVNTADQASGPLHNLADGLRKALPSVHAARSRDIVIGSLGILHPTVLGNFDLTRPCSALEVDVETFL